MDKYFWALCVTFMLVSPVRAQEKLAGRSIEWEPPREYNFYIDANHKVSGKYFHFNHARYFDNENRLPWYYELIPLDRSVRYHVRLTNQQFIPLNDEVELNDAAREQIGEQIDVQSKLSLARGKPYIELSFIPVRRNPMTGDLEGLEHFDIMMERQGAALKQKAMQDQEATAPSVLRRGNWIKLRIESDGVYRMGYSRLKDLGFDDPASVSVYGNNTGVLEVGNDTTPSYRLMKMPVMLRTGEDGTFGKGDYLVFYARGPHEWEFDQSRQVFTRTTHPYTDHSYYYLTDSEGDPGMIAALEPPDGSPQETIHTFPDYDHHEKNDRNLIQSGKRWFGEYFDVRTNQSFDFEFPNIVTDQPARVDAAFVSRSSAPGSFSLLHGQDVLFSENIPQVSYNFTSYYARLRSGSGTFLPGADRITMQVQYEKGTPSAVGWLDYITLNADRELTMAGNQMHFRYRGNQAGRVVALELSNATAGIEIWEVTRNRPGARVTRLDQEGERLRLIIAADTTFREFVAFYPDEAPVPDVMGEVDNQDLHGMEAMDMVVVSKQRFISQAERLADIHRKEDDLKVGVVTDHQIYHEFSAGKPDPSAIRNFLRMIYNRSTQADSLKYLLLFGDGSYDNRKAWDSPFLMTYQSDESLHYSRSFVSDDFFGLLDAGDDIEASHSGLVDLGIGRFPVRETTEARELVDKVERYINRKNWGGWLNKICFVADDEDNNLHMRDADKLASYVANTYPQFDIQKVYFDSYTQQITATGARYPGVSSEINEQINNGILLFNYTGHGGEHHLAHERVLTKEDIRLWSNDSRLPLFMTATCEFTRFDDPGYTSAGEEVFLKPDGGSIASFSTTRLVYASLNYELNKTFYEHVFRKDQQGMPMHLGDVVRLTKNQSGSSNNKRNFSLFGDPALRMPLGTRQVQTDSISPGDTLKALDKVKVYGSIRDEQGLVDEDFSGQVHLKFYDKPRQRKTLGNDQDNPFQYLSRDNLLFSGNSRVREGKFTSEWIVPKDLLPETEPGKLIYFAQDGNRLAQGVHNQLPVGGYSENLLHDQQGPSVELYMNDRDFVPGGITDENPTLIATLSDSSGINTTQTSLGHEISMILDNDQQRQYNLNRYYQAKEGSYRQGELRYQLSGLDKGKHELMLKAWDINNNPSTTSIEFTVSQSDDLKLSKVLNYPNPFTEKTAFYFEHNRPGELLDVLIQIMSVSGKLVKSIHTQVQTSGFRAGPIPWDGRDDFGDNIGRGVYVYKLKVRSARGEVAEKIQKLVILK